MAVSPVNAWPLETRHGFINVRIAKGPAAVAPGMRRDLARLSPSCHRETAPQSAELRQRKALVELLFTPGALALDDPDVMAGA